MPGSLSNHSDCQATKDESDEDILDTHWVDTAPAAPVGYLYGAGRDHGGKRYNQDWVVGTGDGSF